MTYIERNLPIIISVLVFAIFVWAYIKVYFGSDEE